MFGKGAQVVAGVETIVLTLQRHDEGVQANPCCPCSVAGFGLMV